MWTSKLSGRAGLVAAPRRSTNLTVAVVILIIGIVVYIVYKLPLKEGSKIEGE